MSVKIGDAVSTPFSVTSGVPQGSHLGPFIFLLYLNDINFSINCYKLSYADDFKLYAVIRCIEDALALQKQLDIFADWCKINRMVLNPDKCSVISFCRKRSVFSFDYNLFGTSLNRTSSIKDLGVILDVKLSFNDHLSYITSKASKTLGFIFRIGKHFKDVYCLKTLYCSLVRSTLEYCSVVWAPYYQNSTQRLEAIQRKFVRFALRNLPWNDPLNLPRYEDRCKLIDLNLLYVRRDVARACFISDLIQSYIDCPNLLEKLNFNMHRRSLRSQTFLRLPASRTNYGYNMPLMAMCRIFNNYRDAFDFHLSRTTIKKQFVKAISRDS